MADKHLKYPFINGCKDLPKDKDDDLREIKKWLESQPHLPKFSDEFLHLFLHGNYYDLEGTKNNIQGLFSLRSTSPELFSDRSLTNPRVIKELNNHFFAIMPKRTPEGYQVVYIAMNEKKLQDYTHADSVRAVFIFFDIVISECGFCPGYILVYDSKAISLAIFLKIRFGILMKLVKYFQEAAPVRVINVICINSVPFVDRLMSLCRPFIKSSVVNKIQFYSTGSSLRNFYKTTPRDCVFEEYGGTAGSIETAHDNYMKLLETKYSKWIEDESIYAVNKPEQTLDSEPAKRSFFSFWVAKYAS